MSQPRIFMEVVAPAAGQATTEQLLVPVGTWHHPEYGRVTITPEMVAAYAQNFADGANTVEAPDGTRRLVANYNHTRGRASGYIVGVRPSADGLWATFAWTPQATQAIADQEMCYVSPELDPAWDDPDTGQVRRHVLTGAGLVDRPFFKRLPLVQLQPVTADGVRVAAADLTDPVMVFGEPLEGSMTKEEQAALAAAAAGDSQQAADATAADETTTDTEASAAAAGAFSEPAQKRIADLEGTVATMLREKRFADYESTLGELKFGETAAVPMRLAPAGRKALAEALADSAPDLADKVIAAVSGLQLYHDGVIGHGGNAAASTRALDPDEARICEQLGVSPEAYLKEAGR